MAGLTASTPALPPDTRLVAGCRACGAAEFDRVLSLGATPLANSLLPAGSDRYSGPLYPLELMRCRRCSLLQLEHIVSPAALFSEYVYFSSTSDAIVRHAQELVEAVNQREQLGEDSLVVEIASNDGYLLQFFKQRNIPVLGIEPAQNIARVAEAERGIPSLARFFDARLAEELASRGKRADVIIGNNVLAHVPDLQGFVHGVRTLMKPSGVAVFEFPYAKDMLDNVEFDTIYHEHQCYFTLTALDDLFRRSNLQACDVEHVSIHGGSLRLSVCHLGARPPAPSVSELLAEETSWQAGTGQPYAHFAQAVQSLKVGLLAVLDSIKDEGHHIAAYGAAAKGVTLTSYCGIGRNYLDFVVDRSVHKQGLCFPVDALPILEPERLIHNRTDYALLLTWNFADEILRQQADYRAAGGKFIVPVPSARVV